MSRVQPISVAATLSLKCKQPNFTRAPAAQRMAIITSMNMALQDIYSLVPPTYREKTISLGISAPVTGTIDVTLNSKAIANPTGDLATDLADRHGDSVVFSGDENDNVYIRTMEGANTLARPYQGATGTKDVTFYDTGAVFEDAVVRLLEDPRLILSQGRSRRLMRDPNDLRADRYPQQGSLGVGWDFGDSYHYPTGSGPTYYKFVKWAANSEADDRFVIQMWPRPTEANVLEVRAEVGPRMFTFAGLASPSGTHTVLPEVGADVINAAGIPLPEWIDLTVMIPIAEWHLRATDFWASTVPDGITQDRYKNAISQARNLPPDRGLGKNKIRRQLGY